MSGIVRAPARFALRIADATLASTKVQRALTLYELVVCICIQCIHTSS